MLYVFCTKIIMREPIVHCVGTNKQTKFNVDIQWGREGGSVCHLKKCQSNIGSTIILCGIYTVQLL